MEELKKYLNFNFLFNKNLTVYNKIHIFCHNISRLLYYLIMIIFIYILLPIGFVVIVIISLLYSMDRNVKKSDINRIVRQNQVVVYESDSMVDSEEIYIEETLDEDIVDESLSDVESTLSDEELKEQLKEELREEIRAEVEEDVRNELLNEDSFKEEIKSEILNELKNNSDVSDKN